MLRIGMARAAARVVAVLCAVRAAVGLAYIAITPRGDGLHVVAVPPNANRAATSVAISAADASGVVLLQSANTTLWSARTDMGVLSRQPEGPLLVTATTTLAGGATLTQRFTIDAATATPLAGLVWLPGPSNTYTLTPIPAEWDSPYARWSAVCVGVPAVVSASWANRTVSAAASSQCTAQVTMDPSGFVTSDVLLVQGGGLVVTGRSSSGSAKTRVALIMQLFTVLVGMHTL